MMILQVSVFPAPDSPLTIMDCERCPYSVVGAVMLRYALSAMAYT